DPKVVAALREVLRGATHVAATVRAMHDSGWLDELLPEFGALDCLAQADAYHAYTVDEHTLAAIAALEGQPAAPDGGTVLPAAPETRAALLSACGRDVERLDHLYLMTVADVRAVSPRAFTRWKDTLLTRLYESAREEATRGGEAAHPPRDEDELVRELAPRLP